MSLDLARWQLAIVTVYHFLFVPLTIDAGIDGGHRGRDRDRPRRRTRDHRRSVPRWLRSRDRYRDRRRGRRRRGLGCEPPALDDGRRPGDPVIEPGSVVDRAGTFGPVPGSGAGRPWTPWRSTSPEDERAALGALIVEATAAVIADHSRSEQAFARSRNDRNDRNDRNRYRDGLTLDGQGLDPMALSPATLPPASTRETGDAFRLVQTRSVHPATAAAYGILTVADPEDVAIRLSGGRALQRNHLAATVAGLGLQDNQITERIESDPVTAASRRSTHAAMHRRARAESARGDPTGRARCSPPGPSPSLVPLGTNGLSRRDLRPWGRRARRAHCVTAGDTSVRLQEESR